MDNVSKVISNKFVGIEISLPILIAALCRYASPLVNWVQYSLYGLFDVRSYLDFNFYVRANRIKIEVRNFYLYIDYQVTRIVTN